jgi:hypothetical protein
LFILVGSVLILLLLDSGTIKASFLSKVNTATQILTVVYFLAVRAFPWMGSAMAGGWEPSVTGAVVALCALTTTASGLHYLFIGFRQLSNA